MTRRARTPRPSVQVPLVLVYTLLATSGVYMALMTVGGLTVRLFELAAVTWLALALPRLVLPVGWLMGGLCAILGSIVLSVVIHGFESSGVLLLLRMSVAFALVLVVFLGLSQREGGVRNAVVVWAIGGGAVALLGAVAWILASSGVTGHSPLLYQSLSGYRAVSTLPDPNRFASFSAALASVSGLMFLTARRRWGWGALLLVAVLGVLASGSRGGLIAAVLGTTLAFGIGAVRSPDAVGRRLLRRIVPFAAAVGIGVVLVYAYAPNRNVFNRFTGEGMNVREQDQVMTNVRLRYAAYIWEKVSSSSTNLFFGSADYGRIEVDNAENETFSPHNLYLTVLAAQGIVGLTIFLLVLLGLVGRGIASLAPSRQLSHEARSLRTAALGGLLTFLVHGATIVLYTTGFFWIYVGLYLAVVTRSPATLAHSDETSSPLRPTTL